MKVKIKDSQTKEVYAAFDMPDLRKVDIECETIEMDDIARVKSLMGVNFQDRRLNIFADAWNERLKNLRKKE